MNKIEFLEVFNNKSNVYHFYENFPVIYGFSDGKAVIVELLFITSKGVFVFINEDDVNRLDDVFISFEMNYKQHSILRNGKDLLFDLYVYPISVNKETLELYLSKANNLNISSIRRNIRAATDETLAIVEKKDRKDLLNKDLKSISDIESELFTFDESQLRSITDDKSKVQIISGLAGSGKTVILAKKVANLIKRHNRSDFVIAVTFKSRSLKSTFSKLINRFLKDSNYETRLNIMNSWGSKDGDGFYSYIAKHHGIERYSYHEAIFKFGRKNTFDLVCSNLNKELKEEASKNEKLFDVILVDEAQDLGDEFLKLCMKVLKKNGKLIYAYDDFQVLSEGVLKSNTKILFGPNTSISRTPLKICYRTPKQIIVSAHAFGMNIFADVPNQFLNEKKDWESIGYELIQGKFEKDERLVFDRYQPSYFLKMEKDVRFINYDTYENTSDMEKKVNEIVINHLKKGLDINDIMIIDLDSKYYNNFQYFDSNIYILAGSDNPNIFWDPKKVVYSNIHRAKGNESYIIIIINAHKSISKYTPISSRNKLFTAMTRSKYKTYILGEKSEEMNEIIDTFNKIKEDNNKLIFDFPSKEALKTMKSNIKDDKIRTETHKRFENLFNKLSKNDKDPLKELGMLISELDLEDDEVEELIKYVTKK